jgi:PAS domain S-box-containing protein
LWVSGEHPRDSKQGGALADNAITHLVVVGSSAGGIGALSGLVSSLPQDFDAPIVVAQHLDPKRESHLQEILARKSPLPVKTVAEHEPLQAGVVFVVPANRHVNITDSEIDLSSEPASGQPMPSINLLMESAAEVFGENLIAIVLSGTGTDGTEGARTVSQAGGTVIIQDPETAEFGEMPRSLAPSTVDIVTSLEEIGPVLKNLILGIVVPEDCSEDEGRDLEHFLEVLHRNRGVDFRSYKRPTILRRLGRRMTTSDDLQARATELQELAQSREEERRLTEEGRRSAEGFVDQLQNQRSLFEAILENISDAGLAVDTEGQVLFSNQVFEETFGEHTGAEAGPLGSTEVLDESGEKLLREATLSSRAARGESFAMRFAFRGRNGALRPFEARCRPIEGDGVTGACSSSAR